MDAIRSSNFSRSLFEKYELGEFLLPVFLRRVKVKILMVTDGSGGFVTGSFNKAYFGLSTVLDTLREGADYYVEFDVTRAHRQNDPFKPAAGTTEFDRYAPHYEGFRFAGAGKPAGFDINDYDQVWFFGVASVADALSEAELSVVYRWMDEEQGGVFATGDHATFGQAMCSNIPRVSTMRKWTNAQGVPPGNGRDRHTTLMKGHNGTYTFDDESDDIPMQIELKYKELVSWTPWNRRFAPHPLLCGRNGIINILPDHPHEGEVIDERDVVLTRNISLDGYTAAEYPTKSGFQARPENVAYARVQGDHTDGSNTTKGAANAKRFVCIGAYDGHQVDVGRVAVDSTWHHWFDINLIGRNIPDGTRFGFDSGDVAKLNGFNHSTMGREALDKIKNYFINTALWLSSPAKQRALFMRATWGFVHRYPSLERLSPDLSIWELGGVAKDVIGRRAGQCTLRIWIQYELELPRELLKLPPLPCLTCPPIDLFEIYTLGGIVRQMLQLNYDLERKKIKVEEKMVAKAMAKGIAEAVEETRSFYKNSLEQGRRYLDLLDKGWSCKPDADKYLDRKNKDKG